MCPNIPFIPSPLIIIDDSEIPSSAPSFAPSTEPPKASAATTGSGVVTSVHRDDDGNGMFTSANKPHHGNRAPNSNPNRPQEEVKKPAQVNNGNPSCDLCEDTAFDSVHPEMVGVLVDTVIAGPWPCDGLEHAIGPLNGATPAQCDFYQQNVAPICCSPPQEAVPISSSAGVEGKTHSIQAVRSKPMSDLYMPMSGTCYDTPDWYDASGWPNSCSKYVGEYGCAGGDQNPGILGQTANEACCGCGGGFHFPTGSTPIKDASGGWCITAEGFFQGANIFMSECDGSGEQSWIIEEATSVRNGYPVFLIKSSVNTGFSLDINRHDPNLNLHLWDNKPEDTSRYNQEFNTAGYILTGKLYNEATNCLTWADNGLNLYGQDASKRNGGKEICESEAVPEFFFKKRGTPHGRQ